MTALLRWIMGLGLSLALGGVAGLYYGHRFAETKHKAAIAQAEADARQLEQQRAKAAQEALDNADKEAKAREARIRRDASGARTELDRLRNALVANTGPVAPGPSVDDGTVARTTELFLACSKSLVQLGEDADAQLAECKTVVRGLQGWVKAAAAP